MFASLYEDCRKEGAEGAHRCENQWTQCQPVEAGTIAPLWLTTRDAGPLMMMNSTPKRLLTEQCT